MAVRLFVLAICLVMPTHQSHGSEHSSFYEQERWREYHANILRQSELQKIRKSHRPRIRPVKRTSGNTIPLEVFSRNKLWIHVRQKNLRVNQTRMRQLQAEKRRKWKEWQRLKMQKLISERARSEHQRIASDKNISPPSRRDTLSMAEFNRNRCQTFFGMQTCISTAGADIKDCFQTSADQLECQFRPVINCRVDEGSMHDEMLEAACSKTEWRIGRFTKATEGWMFEGTL